jgi:hypothetical protein
VRKFSLFVLSFALVVALLLSCSYTGVSKGGIPVSRYVPKKSNTWQSPHETCIHCEEIEKHFDHLFPDMETFVFHEILSDIVHLDVFIKSPNEKHPYYVLFTSGMSDLAMPLPKGLRKERGNLDRAELFMLLPKDFPMGQICIVGKLLQNGPLEETWPIHWLKFLAKAPHEYKTWFGHSHTVPNGPDYDPLVTGTKQCGCILWQEKGEWGSMVSSDGVVVNLYRVVPLYREEMEYRLEYGQEAWCRLLEKNGGLPLIVDLHRPSLCP